MLEARRKCAVRPSVLLMTKPEPRRKLSLRRANTQRKPDVTDRQEVAFRGHVAGNSRRDVFSQAKRSEVMSRIRGTDTKPEKVLRSLLHRLGYRFRLHGRGLAGRPDVVLARYRTAIFVHGCFWHLHPGCPQGRLPWSNREFWSKKLRANRLRDRRKVAELEAEGWRVLTVWECEVEKDLPRVERRLRKALVL